MAKKSTKKPAKKAPKQAEKKIEKKEKFVPDLSYLATWSPKLGKSVEELQDKLEEWVEILKSDSKKKTWSEEKIWATARRRMYADFKADLRSSAIPWIGKVYWDGRPYDFGNDYYNEAKALYKSNPQLAIQQGKIKIIEGIPTPVDHREEFASGYKNRNFGKPLPEHQWIKTIGGVCMPYKAYENSDYDQIRPFFMTVSNRLADPDNEAYLEATSGIIVKFKGTNKTDSEETECWKINATTVTRFTPVREEFDGEEQVIDYLGDLEDEDGSITKLMHDEDIPNMFIDYYCTLGDLEEYHGSFMEVKNNGTKEVSRRLVVVEGDVADIQEATDDNESNRIYIDDDTLGFGDGEVDENGQMEIQQSLICWADQKIPIEFGKYSRILVFGTTSRRMQKDQVTNEYTGKFGDVSIAVDNIIVLELVEPELEDETPQDDDYSAAGTVQTDGEQPAGAKPTSKKGKW